MEIPNRNITCLLPAALLSACSRNVIDGQQTEARGSDRLIFEATAQFMSTCHRALRDGDHALLSNKENTVIGFRFSTEGGMQQCACTAESSRGIECSSKEENRDQSLIVRSDGFVTVSIDGRVQNVDQNGLAAEHVQLMVGNVFSQGIVITDGYKHFLKDPRDIGVRCEDPYAGPDDLPSGRCLNAVDLQAVHQIELTVPIFESFALPWLGSPGD